MTLTSKELRKMLNKIPDDMPVYLCDVTDDGEEGEGLYEITEASIDIVMGVNRNDEPSSAGIVCFTNKLSEEQ